MNTLSKVLLGVCLVALATAGLEWRRAQDASHAADERALAPAKEAAEIAKSDVQAASAGLTARVDTVTRRLRDTLWRTTIDTVRPVTREDTSRALAQLPVVVAKYDSLHRSCSALVVDCPAYRASAERRFRADSAVIAAQAAVLKDRPPRRSWRLGITGGYGALLSGDHVLTGPSLTAGVTWSPF
jgi:hypothetical protein